MELTVDTLGAAIFQNRYAAAFQYEREHVSLWRSPTRFSIRADVRYTA
jgi:hypothetical protein